MKQLMTLQQLLQKARFNMVNFYKIRVIKGKKKWTDVPSLWNKAVQEELVKEGYILNEDGTVSKPEEK